MWCSKAVLLSVSLLSLNAWAQGTKPDTLFLKKETPLYWAEKSQAIMDGADNMSRPAWLNDQPSEEAFKAAEKLLKRSEIVKKTIINGGTVKDAAVAFKAPIVVKKKDSKESPKKDLLADYELDRSFIFVSQSMSGAELKAAIEESTDTGAVLVFKGIKPGQAIDHISKFVADVLKGNPDLKPMVVINPSLYTKYDVSSVPTTVVHFDGKVIMASGTLSVDYLLGQLEEDKTGDLGVVGPTHPVVEPDMIEEMKRRTALIDWEKAKEGAPGRYWTHSWPQFALPVAFENSSFLVDPTFVVNKDIVAQGKVLVKAGSRYNAQKILPMRQTIAFFDATDIRQLKAVKKHIAEKKISLESTVLVITEIDRKRGFDAMEELNDYFGKNTVVMEKGMIERFRLKALPSIVYGNGDYYKVDEIAVDRKMQ
jgi:conjugal transfer pilus assembly protein TraW